MAYYYIKNLSNGNNLCFIQKIQGKVIAFFNIRAWQTMVLQKCNFLEWQMLYNFKECFQYSHILRGRCF